MKNIHVCPIIGCICKTFYVLIHSFWRCTFCRDFSFYRNQTVLFILTCLLILKAMLEGVYVEELIFPWWFDSHWFPPSEAPFVTFAWNIALATHYMFPCSMLAPGTKVSSRRLSEILLASPVHTLGLLCLKPLSHIL